MRQVQGSKIPGLKSSATEETAEFHGARNRRKKKQRVIDKSTGKCKWLVQLEEQCQPQSDYGLKPVDRGNSDEQAQEHGGGSTAWVKPFGQQCGGK
jgi:hypothetical protein